MKRVNLLAATGVTGVVLAAGVVSPVFAWRPQGKIVKSVQNLTKTSALSDANTSATAVSSQPGDMLKYVIEVRNDGAASSNGKNDMAKIVLTDTLPAGIELVSNPAQRQITEQLGTIKPGAKATKEYTVKVTSQTNDIVIENKACFTGDSTVNDNPQSGCDVADVKVNVPTPTPTPTPPVAQTVQQPVTLPNTGPGSFVLPAMLTSIAGYAAYLLHIKRRVVKQES